MLPGVVHACTQGNKLHLPICGKCAEYMSRANKRSEVQGAEAEENYGERVKASRGIHFSVSRCCYQRRVFVLFEARTVESYFRINFQADKTTDMLKTFSNRMPNERCYEQKQKMTSEREDWRKDETNRTRDRNVTHANEQSARSVTLEAPKLESASSSAELANSSM